MLVVCIPRWDSGHADPPKCARVIVVPFAPPYCGTWNSITNPVSRPALSPPISAQRWNQRVCRPSATAGNVCMMSTPPISCRSMANWVLSTSRVTSAPSLTVIDASLPTRAS